MGGAPAWMGGIDVYATIRAYKRVIVANAQTSILVTKGRHEGPDLVDPLRSQVLTWLSAEAAAIMTTPLPSTAPFSITMGANSVDLAPAGAPAGAKLTFTASTSGTITELSQMQVVAPAASGVHVVFPVFAKLATDGTETDDTSFSNVDLTVAAGGSATMGPGLLLVTDWATGDMMKVTFTKIGSATAGDGGTVVGGCKSVSTFTANAVPAIQANTCLNCHNTGGSGNGALDLSGLAANPQNAAGACAQALNRINTANPAQSDIILAPTGGVAAHPFKNASSTYSTMMQQWIVNEK
jgi:hypothetical protein